MSDSETSKNKVIDKEKEVYEYKMVWKIQTICTT